MSEEYPATTEAWAEVMRRCKEGFKRGEVVIISAASSVGKSFYAQYLAEMRDLAMQGERRTAQIFPQTWKDELHAHCPAEWTREGERNRLAALQDRPKGEPSSLIQTLMNRMEDRA